MDMKNGNGRGERYAILHNNRNFIISNPQKI